MANFFRLLLGLALLPACWAITRCLFAAIITAGEATAGITAESIALLGGVAAFALAWTALSHPVRAYVLGHELTHALWGLAFGSRPSDLKIKATGGSVRLTKTNMLITLAPYFFPFYTFIVIVCALVTYAFLRPLPFLPLWMFLIGFTWAFHILFTIQTLTHRQPDITLYGRVFSWVFIYIVNIAIVLLWLAATTPLTFSQLANLLLTSTSSAYISSAEVIFNTFKWVYNKCIQI
jgi:hypothetical protein